MFLEGLQRSIRLVKNRRSLDQTIAPKHRREILDDSSTTRVNDNNANTKGG